MSAFLPAVAAAVPVGAGWSLHAVWLRRRLDRARRDPLTGLPGRDVFQVRARRMLRAPGVVVVLVDLDRFKVLNDRHGHGAGDAVLATTAARLAVWAEGRGGVVARLGGDEFAAAVTAPGDLPSALTGLHAALCVPVPYRRHQLRVGASVGTYREECLPHPELGRALRRADEAMYAAKRLGGGWQLATGPIPSMTSANGRRTGRRGTSGGVR